MNENKDDAFENNLINIAKKALTPEQQEEYKKIGEYIFSSTDYKTAEMGPTLKEPTEQDILFYASEALKAGADPKDLTPKELQVLTNIYGSNWYTNFGITDDEILKNALSSNTLNRKQRRQIEKLNKKKKKNNRKQ